jgi:hypothetical protein
MTSALCTSGKAVPTALWNRTDKFEFTGPAGILLPVLLVISFTIIYFEYLQSFTTMIILLRSQLSERLSANWFAI